MTRSPLLSTIQLVFPYHISADGVMPTWTEHHDIVLFYVYLYSFLGASPLTDSAHLAALVLFKTGVKFITSSL